ncbi:MAG: plasmid stabilization protein [Flavobacteriaceae bacterium]|nr:plasmid stabilization protein [Flavobacteriaceae bacterium]
MKVLYLKSFLKDIQNLKDDVLKEKVLDVINEIKNAQTLVEISNIKKLKGHTEAYRLRIGKYRLGFYYNENVVEFARFAKREDIYKLFP